MDLKKRISQLVTAVLLAALLIGLMPQLDMQAHAEDTSSGPAPIQLAKDGSLANGPHVHDGITYQPWTKNDELPSSGNYYLTEDVNLTDSWTNDTPNNLHLCLNGHEVTSSGELGIFNLEDHAAVKTEVHIYDCSEGETGCLTGYKNTSADVSSINIKGADNAFTLHSGKICDNESGGDEQGGAITIEAGTFTMEGGTISGNRGMFCGAISIKEGGTFNMSGGSIENNRTKTITADGATVRLGWDSSSIASTMNMSGGSIISNGCIGVTVNSHSTFNLKEGSKITIKDNEYDEVYDSDVFLAKQGQGSLIYVFGTINTESSIGVDLPYPPEEGEEIQITSGMGNNPETIFFSNSFDYEREQRLSIHLKMVSSSDTDTYEAFMFGYLGPQGEKKVNPLTVTAKTKKVNYKALRKKAKKFTAKQIMTVSKAQGTVTYKKVSVNKKGKKFKVNTKTGALTVKKGLKKGLYKVKIEVTAAGNDTYEAGQKTLTVKIKVK